MKHANTIISAVLLAAVAFLFVKVFKTSTVPKISDNTGAAPSHGGNNGAIAYFEMDSVEQQYAYIKDVRQKIKGQEELITNELGGLKKGYMGRIQQLQSKAATMSQQEGEAAQAEINQMQQSMQQREARLSQELQEQQFKLMQDINKRIEEYLKTYNSKKKYAFILSHSPGDNIYYKDSTLDITKDLIKGLNESYKKQ
ncbi:MAG: OmpH family outer membrane protein [Bacteroidetes bacterium]|nr:MAG: OmpH family outer membrane protein [Bacteroidota bacterium]